MIQIPIFQKLRFFFGSVLSLFLSFSVVLADDLPEVKRQAFRAQQQAFQVQQQVVDISVEVNALRLRLLEERFENLQRMAEFNGWEKEQNIPPVASVLRSFYEEWLFLKMNLDIIRCGKHPIPIMELLFPFNTFLDGETSEKK